MTESSSLRYCCPGTQPELELLRASALSSQPMPFVYLVKNGDLHKIGITNNLEQRMKELKPDAVIHTVELVELTNAAEIEKILHQRFANKRLPQTEHFRLTEEEVQQAIALCEIPAKILIQQETRYHPVIQAAIGLGILLIGYPLFLVLFLILFFLLLWLLEVLS